MDIFETLEGVWRFTLTLTETAPLSVWQFVIAVIVPACLYRYMHRMPCTRLWNRRFGREAVDWGMETIALMSGIALAWIPWRTTAGLLIGICAGLLSPYLSKGAGVVVTYAWAYIRTRFPKPTA